MLPSTNVQLSVARQRADVSVGPDLQRPIAFVDHWRDRRRCENQTARIVRWVQEDVCDDCGDRERHDGSSSPDPPGNAMREALPRPIVSLGEIDQQTDVVLPTLVLELESVPRRERRKVWWQLRRSWHHRAFDQHWHDGHIGAGECSGHLHPHVIALVVDPPATVRKCLGQPPITDQHHRNFARVERTPNAVFEINTRGDRVDVEEHVRTPESPAQFLGEASGLSGRVVASIRNEDARHASQSMFPVAGVDSPAASGARTLPAPPDVYWLTPFSQGCIHGVTGQPSAAAMSGNAVAPSIDSRTMSA